jgi:hypothetical protein
MTTKGILRVQVNAGRQGLSVLDNSLDVVSGAISPRFPNVIFVTVVSGNIYLLIDGPGVPKLELIATEAELHTSEPISWLAVPRDPPGVLFAATKKGLFSWQPSPARSALLK